ncbi:MAG TPA: DUF3326 domain-containing protein, partial [Lacipirellulaceae bacterium]|nr:DUF3326 domain-containing protein [Lacipirellulaceae bacterium]
SGSPLASLQKAVTEACGRKSAPIRVALVSKNRLGHTCEMEAIGGATTGSKLLPSSVFDFRRRTCERTSAFNAVMLIPTGVDCAIGGHAGDATPAARLMASQVDNLVIHPNVVNASDINEQAENCLYAEGSLICRLMMGTIGLRKVRQNRVLLVTEERPDAPHVVDNTINCAEGARATLGMDIADVLVLEDGLHMQTGVSESGRVTGSIDRMGSLLDVLLKKRGAYDAVALATRITPHIDTVELHRAYFGKGGPNPWGGVEAVLTHTTSTVLNAPTAHAPTMSSEAIRTERWGVVEPRKAAEVISSTYLFCVLKGLNRAPQVVTKVTGIYDPSMVQAEDISALVIPDGCVGLPTLAAVEQGIPVIAVRNNTNLMRNDLRDLPFRDGQLIYAENYYEAAGVLAALRHGVSPSTLARPMAPIRIERIPAPKVKVTVVAAANGNGNGHSHANGNANGNGKSKTNGRTNGHTVAAKA